MRIHFGSTQDTTDLPAPPDTAETVDSLAGAQSTAYDTIWSEQEVPTQQPTALEEVMLQQDKIYVVLAVVLLIWFGLAAFLFRTNRRIRTLEQQLDASEDLDPSETVDAPDNP